MGVARRIVGTVARVFAVVAVRTTHAADGPAVYWTQQRSVHASACQYVAHVEAVHLDPFHARAECEGCGDLGPLHGEAVQNPELRPEGMFVAASVGGDDGNQTTGPAVQRDSTSPSA